MSKSPGHRQWSDHKVSEQHVGQPVLVEVRGEAVADSKDVVRVDEDRSPPRYYFPRAGVKMHALERSKTTTDCPFKGTAHYYNLRVGGEELADAVWTYEDPYEEHLALKDRLAFYDDKFPEIHVRLKNIG